MLGDPGADSHDRDIDQRSHDLTARISSVENLPRITTEELRKRLPNATEYEAMITSKDSAKVFTGVKFFKELFSALEVPAKYQNPVFVHNIHKEIVQVPTVEVFAEYAMLLVYFYKHEFCEPSEEIISWAEAQFQAVNPPLTEASVVLLCSLFRLFEATSAFVHFIEMPAFYEHLVRFVGLNLMLDARIASLLVQVCVENSSAEVYQCVFQIILALASSPFLSDFGVATDVTNIVQRVLSVLKASAVPNDSLRAVLTSISRCWNMSEDVNENLFMIGQLLDWDDLSVLRGTEGEAAMLNGVTSLSSGEAIILLGCVAKSTRNYDSLLPTVCHGIFHEGYGIATSAGICLSHFMTAAPSLFAESFSVECDDSDDSPNDQNYARAALRILVMNDSESTIAVLDGMCSLYSFFLKQDHTHEFSEILDFYRISDVIEQLISHSDPDVSKSAEFLYMTIRGEFVYTSM